MIVHIDYHYIQKSDKYTSAAIDETILAILRFPNRWTVSRFERKL